MLKIFSRLCTAALVLFFAACSDDNVTINELQNLQLVTTFTNASHNIEFYTPTGTFQTGYNAIYFQLKDASGNRIKNAVASWQPLMHMMSMEHSCPASSINKKQHTESTYGGYIVFQMAGNDMEYWELTLNYSIDGTNYSVTETIQVTAAPKRTVESFMASDNKRYVLALAEPSNPRVGINNMHAVLYEMESMTAFTPVDGYTIKIDPRMPGMGNHSSPNNVDLTQDEDNLYTGKLSLTMTGYWKINLQLEDSSGNVLKGEPITDEVESSSIYFELEF